MAIKLYAFISYRRKDMFAIWHTVERINANKCATVRLFATDAQGLLFLSSLIIHLILFCRSRCILFEIRFIWRCIQTDFSRDHYTPRTKRGNLPLSLLLRYLIFYCINKARAIESERFFTVSEGGRKRRRWRKGSRTEMGK